MKSAIATGLLASVFFACAGIAAIADDLDVYAGKALFERRWIPSPSSTSSANGLGPLFNATSCDGCHKDGGAAIFISDGNSLAVRGFIVRQVTPTGEPDPLYGRQLQERAVPGVVPEARIFPMLVKVPQQEGEPPLTRMLAILKFNGPVPESRSEFRAAPSLAGRGLIARVDANAVLALADPDDRDGNGIFGHPRQAVTAQGVSTLGRFGWKANSSSIAQSVTRAAATDMGLGSTLEPYPHGDCTPQQIECMQMPTGIEAGKNAELDDASVGLLTQFVESIAVPKSHEGALEPKAFDEAQCGLCHVPKMPATGGGTVSIFSDLLLHNMGPGLAGAAPDGNARAEEWRTAPLIDLDPRQGKRRYLHDGRAANVEEAVLWHGGEAQRARELFKQLPAQEKADLIRYLQSL